MAISSISNNNWQSMLSSQGTTADFNSPQQNQSSPQDTVQLSEYARSLMQEAQSQQGSTQDKSQDEKTNESVQVSSSIGRSSRITGLSRAEVTDLYRSIENMT
ncbi:hypothetical protein [Marinomonas epiphytica]